MSTPPELVALVDQLWRRKFLNETSAFESKEFAWLVKFCRDHYCVPATLSEVDVEHSYDIDAQRNELQRCFKNLGAPWYGQQYPSSQMIARKIHHAYAAGEDVENFILLPLDLINDLPNVKFGPWQIRNFSQSEFGKFIDVDKLRRFGAAFVPDIDRLSQLSWLMLRRATKRRFDRVAAIFSNIDLSNVGVLDPSPRTFDVDVERGLFVLALYPWEEKFGDRITPWQPFRIPWTYTISRDVFSSPSRAPNADMLTWGLVSDSNDEVWEVPQILNNFDRKDSAKLQKTLSRWWRLVGRVSPLGQSGLPGLNPRVEHFFLRGFLETKIDELLWHVTTIDAAIGKESTSIKSKLARRIRALTKKGRLADKFEQVHYKRRSEFVHGKHLSEGQLWASDLADARRVARAVVVSLIEFVASRSTWTRDEVIKYLDRPN